MKKLGLLIPAALLASCVNPAPSSQPVESSISEESISVTEPIVEPSSEPSIEPSSESSEAPGTVAHRITAAELTPGFYYKAIKSYNTNCDVTIHHGTADTDKHVGSDTYNGQILKFILFYITPDDTNNITTECYWYSTTNSAWYTSNPFFEPFVPTPTDCSYLEFTDCQQLYVYSDKTVAINAGYGSKDAIEILDVEAITGAEIKSSEPSIEPSSEPSSESSEAPVVEKTADYLAIEEFIIEYLGEEDLKPFADTLENGTPCYEVAYLVNHNSFLDEEEADMVYFYLKHLGHSSDSSVSFDEEREAYYSIFCDELEDGSELYIQSDVIDGISYVYSWIEEPVTPPERLNIDYDFYAKMIANHKDIKDHYAGYELTDDPAIIKINCEYEHEINVRWDYYLRYESNHNWASWYYNNNGTKARALNTEFRVTDLKYSIYFNIVEGTVNGNKLDLGYKLGFTTLVLSDNVFMYEPADGEIGDAHMTHYIYHDGDINKNDDAKVDAFNKWFATSGLTADKMLEDMCSMFRQNGDVSACISYSFELGDPEVYMNPDYVGEEHTYNYSYRMDQDSIRVRG